MTLKLAAICMVCLFGFAQPAAAISCGGGWGGGATGGGFTIDIDVDGDGGGDPDGDGDAEDPTISNFHVDLFTGRVSCTGTCAKPTFVMNSSAPRG